MRHVTYGEKSLLMDDETARALMDYAAAIAQVGGGDSVTVRAVGSDGNEVDVSFLLNSATVMVSESASGLLHPPQNDEAVRYMRAQVELSNHPPPVEPEEDDDL